MRRILFIVLAAALLHARPAGAGESGSRALSGWLNVTAENGWRGRRYMDGASIFAEEFATAPAGPIDVWRFYRAGILTSEERDLNLDGKVDFETRWDSRTGLLSSIRRDTSQRGVNDLEIERTGNNRWEIHQDRNLDGVTDRILFFDAPNDLFERPELEAAAAGDWAAAIPRESWREMWTDDGYTGSITDYYRFNNRGVLVQHGREEGRRIAWRRVPPDYLPAPSLAPAAVSAPARPAQGTPFAPPPLSGEPPLPAQAQAAQARAGGGDPALSGAFAPPRIAPPPEGGAAGEGYDPAAAPLISDPYAGVPGYADPGYAVPGYPAPGGYPAGGSPQFYVARQPVVQPMPEPSAGESYARSVPVRMRPPGTSGRRPGRF